MYEVQSIFMGNKQRNMALEFIRRLTGWLCPNILPNGSAGCGLAAPDLKAIVLSMGLFV